MAAVAAGQCEDRAALTRQIDCTELLEAVQTQSAGTALQLLDAREQARFDGREEPIDPIAGHIQGATCTPFAGNLTASGHFRSRAELAQRFAASDAATVCYCGSGVTAAHNVLAMVHGGRPEPRLYPGSWSQWIIDPQRPRQP